MRQNQTLAMISKWPDDIRRHFGARLIGASNKKSGIQTLQHFTQRQDRLHLVTIRRGRKNSGSCGTQFAERNPYYSRV